MYRISRKLILSRILEAEIRVYRVESIGLKSTLTLEVSANKTSMLRHQVEFSSSIEDENST